MIKRAIAMVLALGMAQPGFGAGVSLQSQTPDGMQPLFALAANLCVGAMRMGNALPLRVLDHIGESPSLGMENRMYADADRMIEVILAGNSPGQPEVPGVFCVVQPHDAMSAPDKAALRDWFVAEFERAAEAEGVWAYPMPAGHHFGRIIYWCDGVNGRLVMAISQSGEEAELRLGVARTLPDGSPPDCPGGVQ